MNIKFDHTEEESKEFDTSLEHKIPKEITIPDIQSQTYETPRKIQEEEEKEENHNHKIKSIHIPSLKSQIELF